MRVSGVPVCDHRREAAHRFLPSLDPGFWELEAELPAVMGGSQPVHA